MTVQQTLIDERNRLTAAIDANTYRDQHVALFAARQALSWALNSEEARAPYAMIMGSQAASEVYPSEPSPALS